MGFLVYVTSFDLYSSSWSPALYTAKLSFVGLFVTYLCMFGLNAFVHNRAIDCNIEILLPHCVRDAAGLL